MWLLHMLRRNCKSWLAFEAQTSTTSTTPPSRTLSCLNGGSCTAEVISSQGLVLTNHHRAWRHPELSTPENDYLTDGFWAKAKTKMHIEDFYVSFVRIDDVTERVLSKVNDDMPEGERGAAVAAELDAIKKSTWRRTPPTAAMGMKTMYYGNEFYVFTYQDYNVRRWRLRPSVASTAATPTTGCGHVTQGLQHGAHLRGRGQQPRRLQRACNVPTRPRHLKSAWRSTKATTP